MAFGLRRAKDVWLIVVQLVSKTFNLCDPYPPTSHKNRQTDVADGRHTISILNTMLCTKVHRAVIIMPH